MQRFVNDFFALILIMKYCKTIDNIYFTELQLSSLGFIQASNPAKKLLEEKDRKKFFQKYSSVSQELEKCLDCLLLISDSVTALGDEDTLGKF